MPETKSQFAEFLSAPLGIAVSLQEGRALQVPAQVEAIFKNFCHRCKRLQPCEDAETDTVGDVHRSRSAGRAQRRTETDPVLQDEGGTDPPVERKRSSNGKKGVLASEIQTKER